MINIIFLQFCLLSVKRMKNQDMNTIVRTARILDSNPCLWGSLVLSETVWIPNLTSLTTPPPPTLQPISILFHITFTTSAKVPSPRAILSDGIQRGLFLLSYFPLPFLIFFPCCCLHQGATSWGCAQSYLSVLQLQRFMNLPQLNEPLNSQIIAAERSESG